MPDIVLREVKTLGNYGLVTVRNADGSFNREFKITGAELAQLHKSGNAPPPGVSTKEWESGLSVVAGKDLEVGDVQHREDGGVLIKYDEIDETAKGGRLLEKHLLLKSGEWTGVSASITVAKPILDAAYAGKTEAVVTEINSGVLRWQ